ncbi:DUF2341 domain-containing protein [Methanothermococcus sp.]|uniref:DUF2341 domain-containing protein n=1 Tax=Methanothermococcus sp. TaxID=2614238 RepID=UPI0025E34929|nr:DUF2341 domain-containing protein [Methanothermococcus sp.]
MKKAILLLLLILGIGAVHATEYPYWIEDDGNGQYYIWTKVNVSANGDTVIYIKKIDGYQPDGDKVFEFFDGFNDLSKWTTNGWVSTTLEGNPSPCATSSSVWKYMYANTQLPQSYIISFDFNTSTLFNVIFACNASGCGYVFRVDSRSGNYPGFGQINGWGARFHH